MYALRLDWTWIYSGIEWMSKFTIADINLIDMFQIYVGVW